MIFYIVNKPQANAKKEKAGKKEEKFYEGLAGC